MTIVLEKRNLRSYEIKQQKQKKNKNLLSIIVTIVAVLLILFAINIIKNKSYTSFDITHKIERSDDNSANYVKYKNNILKYSRDGAAVMDAAGNQLWNGTYEMKNPIVDICGDYVAISDKGYKTINIFDGKDKMNSVEVPHPIITTEVANQGVIAVLMEGDNVNYISFYDKEGKVLVETRSVIKDNGFPVDIAISNDGKKLAASYVTINNGTIQSKVTFNNFGEVGQNYILQVVGGFDYGQTLIGDLEFIDNDTVVAFGDNKFSVYTMKEVPELLYQKKVDTEIKSILHSEQYIGIVTENTTGDKKYSLLLYDRKGNKKLDKSIDYDFNTIYLSKDEIIMYSGQEWVICRINGKEKLHHTFNDNISFVLPGNKLNKYIVINDRNIDEVLLTR